MDGMYAPRHDTVVLKGRVSKKVAIQPFISLRLEVIDVYTPSIAFSEGIYRRPGSHQCSVSHLLRFYKIAHSLIHIFENDKR